MIRTSVKKHNEAVLKEVEKGDIVEFPRDVISHFAIFEGGEDVIHFNKDKDQKVSIQRDNFFEVCKNSKAEKCNFLDNNFPPRDKDDIVETARSMIGDKGYNPFTNNCEHFATLCRNKKPFSKQAFAAIITIIVSFIFMVILAVIIAIITTYVRHPERQREEENPSRKKGFLYPLPF